jgi:hypothetical protein
MMMWLLLFGSADGGELDELEVQRADGEPIKRLPDPADWEPRPVRRKQRNGNES